ncbi:MAG: DUF4838 domain-containing protein [Armatimonadia bacterium]|nr:DUF4838 domain-containing protein [Armatimonadia bacterium]
MRRLEVLRSRAASETVAFAAHELARYVVTATGRATEVRGARLPEPNSIVLRDVDARDREPPNPAPPSGDDAYTVRTGDGTAVLSGGSPRGLLFAVYGFLHTHLGCRWYGPYGGDQIVPADKADALERLLGTPSAATEDPDFAFRMREFRDFRPDVEGIDDRIIAQVDWWAKLGMDCFLLNFYLAHNERRWERWRETLIPEIARRGLRLGIGEHGSYALFLSPARYAADHPEWYCEIDGQRLGGFQMPKGGQAQFCTTNKGAVATYTENLLAFAAENPEISVFYPAPNDVAGWCQCATCREIPIADRYLGLTNAVAEALERDRPDARVIHLAYANHREPPERTVPHPMVDVDVACWGRDFAYPLRDPRTMPERPDYMHAFERWIEICRSAGGESRVLYHCKLMRGLWLGPHLLPLEVVDDDMRFVHELGIEGFDFPLAFDGIRTRALNAYAIARKCWDVETDVDTLVDEHFSLTYGEHANSALEACRGVDRAFDDLRYGSSTALVPGEGLPNDHWANWPQRPPKTAPETMHSTHVRRVRELGEAVSCLPTIDETADPVGARLRDLRTMIEQPQWEQGMLARLSRLAATIPAEAAPGDLELRRTVEEALADLEAHLAEGLEAYSLEDHLAGLLWAGASQAAFERIVPAWREHAENRLEGIEWVVAGHWATEDFVDQPPVISKWQDITELVSCRGPVHVRWRWTGGELGVYVAETSLWRDERGGPVCLDWDMHRGFTGWRDEEPVYRLRLREYDSSARYLVMGRLSAPPGHGTIADRGTHGQIEVGTRAIG